MSVSLMPLAVMQLFGDDGAPLSGASLYTYQSGTAIPKITYVDSSATTVNTNPIILDAGGRADVWLDGVYSMRLVDAEGAVIWTRDNIGSSDQVQYASLQNQIDAINTNLGDYAPLVSPALLGIPTAPTANAATQTDQLATTSFVHNVVDQGVTSITFIGMVVAFATPVAPTGWLACDGSSVSRTTYANLFSVIGTTFGNGDGVSTFGLPDAKNKRLVGWDQVKVFGTTETTGTSGTSGTSDLIVLVCIKA